MSLNKSNNINSNAKPLLSSSNNSTSLVIPRNPKLGQVASSALSSSSTPASPPPPSQTTRQKSTSIVQGNTITNQADVDHKLCSNNSDSKTKVEKTVLEEKKNEKSEKSNAEVEEQDKAAVHKNKEGNFKSSDIDDEKDDEKDEEEDDDHDNITNK